MTWIAPGVEPLLVRLEEVGRTATRDHVTEGRHIDSRSTALLRIGAAVCEGTSESTYAEMVEAALAAGATSDDVLAALLCVADIAGGPRIVAAAPGIAKALRYDIDGALERE